MENTGKEAFILPFKIVPQLVLLTDEEVGMLVERMFVYHVDGIDVATGVQKVDVVFAGLKGYFRKNQKKYNLRCEPEVLKTKEP